jgi:hypothetical protein
MMKSRILLVAALALSWIASGMIGGLLVLRFSSLRNTSTSTLRVRDLEIVDDQGKTRISLGMEHDQPSIRLLSSTDVPLIRFAVDETTSNQSPKITVPTFELNDSQGANAIQMYGNPGQRGLLAFSSPRFEGKVMLGHFGITDDGTDTGLWGLQVSSRLGGMHTDRLLGVMTSNGNDTNLVWPTYSADKNVK